MNVPWYSSDFIVACGLLFVSDYQKNTVHLTANHEIARRYDRKSADDVAAGCRVCGLPSVVLERSVSLSSARAQ